MNGERFDAALAEISSWPGTRDTAHRSTRWRRSSAGVAALQGRARRFGLAASRPRRRLRVANVLRHKVMRRGLPDVTSRRLSGAFADSCARHRDLRHDGNHGRSVAWARSSSAAGASSSSTSTSARAARRHREVRRRGARVEGNYDDAVRHAAATRRPAAGRWSPTPRIRLSRHPARRDAGYGVMAAEIADQLGGTPRRTCLRRRASARWPPRCAPALAALGEARPRFVVVEPLLADCVYRSSRPAAVVVGGSLDTVMRARLRRGLGAGVEILHGGANARWRSTMPTRWSDAPARPSCGRRPADRRRRDRRRRARRAARRARLSWIAPRLPSTQAPRAAAGQRRRHRPGDLPRVVGRARRRCWHEGRAVADQRSTPDGAPFRTGAIGATGGRLLLRLALTDEDKAGRDLSLAGCANSAAGARRPIGNIFGLRRGARTASR